MGVPFTRINTDGAAKILVLLLVDVFSLGVCAFSTFIEVRTTMVAEFYQVIHAIEETQKMRLCAFFFSFF